MEEEEKQSPPNSNSNCSYFVVKCQSIENLHRCIETRTWAYRQRAKPPQPCDLLEKAHSTKGKVILIFSVNNQRGWHGYCESLFPNKLEEEKDLNFKMLDGEMWSPFSVKWITNFLSISSHTCLPLEKTKGMFCMDNTPVNQARNWHQLSFPTGSAVCDLIDEYLTISLNKKQAIEKNKLDSIENKSFFKEEESAVGFCEDISVGWNHIIEKVRTELGKIILACPFGSQRYNCSLPDSDTDILIVYQAKTVDILSLDTPPQTLKNSQAAKMDYTVLELQRYCELLAGGDPRYVETLFLEEEEAVLAFASDSWRDLCGIRQHLLTLNCLEKYLREAQGTKGVKQFEKWKSELKEGAPTPPKMYKLAYIILRLLQSAREMVKDGFIKVYRKNESKERKELLNARQGHICLTSLTSLFDSYLGDIEEMRQNVSLADNNRAKLDVQDWLVKTRLQNLNIDNHVLSIKTEGKG